jgi:hypothetical protein
MPILADHSNADKCGGISFNYCTKKCCVAFELWNLTLPPAFALTLSGNILDFHVWFSHKASYMTYLFFTKYP